MANLLSELDAVVGLCDKASAMMPSVEGDDAIREAETAATNWVITYHAEIAAAVRDAERYRWLRENVDWKPQPENAAGKVYLVATMVSAAYGDTNDQTDAAIDAAMSAREGQG